MSALINRIKDWWQGADRTQKLVSIFGSLFLVALLGFTIMFASKPKMQPLYAGLNPSDQGMVVEELRKRGITVELGPQGAVMVPTDKLDEAKMLLAVGNKLPNPGPKGSEWLEGLNSFKTPAQEREMIKAAKEGELARSIGTLDGVASALVHINFGKDSPFSEEQIEPSAVVNVQEASAGLQPEEGKAIARLVQNSIPGLKPENVSVINAAGQLIFDGTQEASSDGIASKKLETETRVAKSRETDLQRRLDVAFGPGNTVAMVQVELNMDNVNQDKTERELGDKKVTGEATEELGDANAPGASGAAGITSNNPAAPASPGATQGKVNYKSSQKSIDYPSTETHTTTRKAAGSLASMTVSVIANATKIKDVAPIKAILNDYLGGKAGQAGFTANVQSVPFDTTASDAEKKATSAAAGQAQMQQIVSILPIVALIIVGFMVAKAVTKIPGRTLTMALPNGGSMPFDPSLAGQTHHPGEIVPIEGSAILPGLTSVAQLAQTDPELAAALTAMGIDTIDDSVDVEAIRQRIDLPLEQIKKMARQKPQAVALLLKSWLMEERR
ncbi:MAG: flagellar M-ring protein FliF [Armatimonadetes bacterium]|nr:flagellar M-ring protein FliF [Armatimonadota bacterium]